MTKKEFRETIKADLYRYLGDTSLRAFLKCFFNIEGFRFTYILRKCAYHKAHGSKLEFYFFRLFLARYRLKYGFDIYYECKIGKGFYLGHFGGVFINPDTIIGCNVNIAQGVTIGQTNRGKNKGVPQIGDKVWIGTNAIIVGNVKVGNNVLIGPGAYVNFDVPDNAVVIGNPGKIISYNGTESYINRTLS